MSAVATSARLSIGAALYFDHDLSAEPAPLVALLEKLFGDSAPASTLVQWFHRVDNGRTTPGTNYELSGLARRVLRGETSTAAVETPPKTPEPDQVMVLAHTTPSPRLRDPLDQAWRYDLVLAVGPTWLHRLSPGCIVDATVAFADAVGASAGVMLWAESMRFASDLAWAVGASSGLGPAERARVSDEMYWRSRWGRIIRGPSWGTILGTTHVERLGGIVEVERAVAPARVVPLGSGGAFVQATPIDAPIVELADTGEPLVQLSRVLEPVMGHRM